MYEINIKWLMTNYIMIVEPVGDFEASKANKVLSELKGQLDKATHPIHFVVNLVGVRTAVKDPILLQNAVQRLRRHPRIGSVTFVTANPTLRFGAELLAQFLCTQFVVVETFEQITPIIEKLKTGLVPKIDFIPCACL